MSEKNFYELFLADPETATESLPKLREKWFHEERLIKDSDAEPLWSWLGWPDEDEFYKAWGYGDLHNPAVTGEGADEETRELATNLWYQANHFAERNIRYTRNHNIYRIVYGDSDWAIVQSYMDGIKYASQSLPDVIHQIGKTLFHKENEGLNENNPLDELRRIPEDMKLWEKIDFLLFRLRCDFRAHVDDARHLPDGVSETKGTIYFWEEDGELAQQMTPVMASLIAEFILDQPDNPHAVRIAAELKRVDDDYAERIKRSGVRRISKSSKYRYMGPIKATGVFAADTAKAAVKHIAGSAAEANQKPTKGRRAARAARRSR